MLAGNIDAAEESNALHGTIKTINNVVHVIPSVRGCWKTYYQNIANCLLHKGEQPLVTMYSAKRTMMVIEAAIQSARTNRVVQVDID